MTYRSETACSKPTHFVPSRTPVSRNASRFRLVAMGVRRGRSTGRSAAAAPTLISCRVNSSLLHRLHTNRPSIRLEPPPKFASGSSPLWPFSGCLDQKMSAIDMILSRTGRVAFGPILLVRRNRESKCSDVSFFHKLKFSETAKNDRNVPKLGFRNSWIGSAPRP